MGFAGHRGRLQGAAATGRLWHAAAIMLSAAASSGESGEHAAPRSPPARPHIVVHLHRDLARVAARPLPAQPAHELKFVALDVHLGCRQAQATRCGVQKLAGGAGARCAHAHLAEALLRSTSQVLRLRPGLPLTAAPRPPAHLEQVHRAVPVLGDDVLQRHEAQRALVGLPLLRGAAHAAGSWGGRRPLATQVQLWRQLAAPAGWADAEAWGSSARQQRLQRPYQILW